MPGEILHPPAENLQWVRQATNLTIGSSAAFIGGSVTLPLGAGNLIFPTRSLPSGASPIIFFLDAELNFVVVTRKLHVAFRHSVLPSQFCIIKSARAELKSCL